MKGEQRKYSTCWHSFAVAVVYLASSNFSFYQKTPRKGFHRSLFIVHSVLRVTTVSYLNTKPLLYGIFQAGLEQELEISLDIPSECARKLISGEAELGLIPVGVLPQIADYRIVSDYCIGAEREVKTVCIFSQVPLAELTHLYLDYHSQTSVRLAQVLLKEYWQLAPTLLPAEVGFIDKIHGTTGAVIIGDRTLGLDERFAYVYDLAKAWHDHTKLPFVFAAWVARAPLPVGFEARFNAALASGIAHIPQLVQLIPSPHPKFSLEEYYTRYISYTLDAPKRAALALFLEKISAHGVTATEMSPRNE